MTTTELVRRLAERRGISQREAHRLVTRYFERIAEHLSEGRTVVLRGFGSFSTRVQPSRTARVPSSGRQVLVPSARRVQFRPSPKLKDWLKREEDA